MGGGYGLESDEVKALQKDLDKASVELGMRNFTEKASLEGALTTQSVSPHEQVEETVEQVIIDLTAFVDNTYPRVSGTMQEFIAEAHVTINGMAEGVAKAGEDYEVQEQQVKEWLDKYSD